MGDFDAYRNYERSQNDSGEVNADIYGRIDVASLNNSYSDDSGEFVSDRRANEGVSLSQKQKAKVKTKHSIHRPTIHTDPHSMDAIDGERIVDIVCILITIVGLILIAINFHAILDAIMQVIYPIIEIVILIVLLFVLGVLAWLLLRRRFSSFRF